MQNIQSKQSPKHVFDDTYVCCDPQPSMEETQGEALSEEASRRAVCQFYSQNLVRDLLMCFGSGPCLGPCYDSEARSTEVLDVTVCARIQQVSKLWYFKGILTLPCSSHLCTGFVPLKSLASFNTSHTVSHSNDVCV